MKFREYGKVKPMVITELSGEFLEKSIESVGERMDIIDLQYSTGYDPREQVFWYSALLLVKEKENVLR